MKCKYILLSMMIASPKQPGNDIDVYLRPLIEDLTKLWVEGVEVYDANEKQTFTLRAMIFCTVNDFLAYGNLSGHSVKGHNACPICEKKHFLHPTNTWEEDSVYKAHKIFKPKSPISAFEEGV